MPISEFQDWPVHLLGGRPERQRDLARAMNVVSADGNYAGMKARRFCQYFDGKRWIPDGGQTKMDVPYRVFKISCENILAMWEAAQ